MITQQLASRRRGVLESESRVRSPTRCGVMRARTRQQGLLRLRHLAGLLARCHPICYRCSGPCPHRCPLRCWTPGCRRLLADVGVQAVLALGHPAALPKTHLGRRRGNAILRAAPRLIPGAPTGVCELLFRHLLGNGTLGHHRRASACRGCGHFGFASSRQAGFVQGALSRIVKRTGREHCARPLGPPRAMQAAPLPLWAAHRTNFIATSASRPGAWAASHPDRGNMRVARQAVRRERCARLTGPNSGSHVGATVR